MTILSLREGVQEHLLIGNHKTEPIRTAPEPMSFADYSSGYFIKYAHNTHETCWLNGKKIVLSPGESLFLNQSANRSFRNDPNQDSKGLFLFYQNHELEGLFNHLRKDQLLDYPLQALRKVNEIRFEKHTHLNHKLSMICTDLEGDLNRIERGGFDSVLEELLLEIDWELLGYNQRLSAYNPATRQELVRKVIKARKFMKANLHMPLRLEDIANEAGMSPFHFQRQYKKTTGLSPTRNLTEWRINRAKKLLADKSLSILEISTMLSYTDLPTFSKAFKRETGLSPSQWKASQEN